MVRLVYRVMLLYFDVRHTLSDQEAVSDDLGPRNLFDHRKWQSSCQVAVKNKYPC